MNETDTPWTIFLEINEWMNSAKRIELTTIKTVATKMCLFFPLNILEANKDAPNPKKVTIPIKLNEKQTKREVTIRRNTLEMFGTCLIVFP